MRTLYFIVIISLTLSCKEKKIIAFELEFSKIGTIIHQENKMLYYLDYKIEDDNIFWSKNELSCDTIRMNLTAYEMEKIHNAFLINKIHTFDDNNNDIGDIVDEIHTDRNLEKYTIFTNRRKIVINYQNTTLINSINKDKTKRFKIFHSILDTIYSKKIEEYFKDK